MVSKASLPDQRVIETTLAAAADDVAASGIRPPAIICIGAAVRLRAVLDWVGQMAGDAPRDLDPLGLRPLADSG